MRNLLLVPSVPDLSSSIGMVIGQNSFHPMSQRRLVPGIVRFAIGETCRLEAYVSSVPDQGAMGVEAFSIVWFGYGSVPLFPPTSRILVGRMLLLPFRIWLLFLSWPGQISLGLLWLYVCQGLVGYFLLLVCHSEWERLFSVTSSKFFQHLPYWNFERIFSEDIVSTSIEDVLLWIVNSATAHQYRSVVSLFCSLVKV